MDSPAEGAGPAPSVAADSNTGTATGMAIPNQNEDVVDKVKGMMRSIVEADPNPDPRTLHALAAILEKEEMRYVEQTGHPYNNNLRSSHTIGRLLNLIREDDEFFEFISLRLFGETGQSLAVRVAGARLLHACVSCWPYPYIFEEPVLAYIKQLVIEDIAKDPIGSDIKKETRASTPKESRSKESEMLRTYALGLFAIALSGSDIVEEVLTTGLAAKLMRNLRVVVLGESDVCTDNKVGNAGITVKGKEEVRGRIRPSLEVARNDEARAGDRLSEKTAIEYGSKDAFDGNEDRSDEEDVLDGRTDIDGYDDGSMEERMGEDKRRKREKHNEGKGKSNPSSLPRDETHEEGGKAEASRRKSDRDRVTKVRGKGRTSDVQDGEKHSQQINQSENLRASTSSQENGKPRKDRKTKAELSVDAGKSVEIRKETTLNGGEMLSSDASTGVFMVGGVDVSPMMRLASRAAQQEALTANASVEAFKAAGDAASELVKAAALEALAKESDAEGILAVANAAAATVIDAALATSAFREDADKHPNTNSSIGQEEEHGVQNEHAIDLESLVALKERFCVQCLEKLGEYMEVLGPVLQEKGVDVCLALMKRHSESRSLKDMMMLADVLKLVCALAAHRKFAAVLVDRGGIQQLLATPRVPQTLTGISYCLFAFASIQVVMERVCTLPSPVIHDVVALALELLDCSQDAARRNAALFFGTSFVFRAVIDAFDMQDGLRRLLNLLRNTVALRSGGTSTSLGTNLAAPGVRVDRGSSAEVLTSSEKQLAYHACFALRQYFRSQLLLLVDTLRPYKGHRGTARIMNNARAAYKPLDISNEAMETVIQQLQRDRKLGPAFVKAKWPALENFMNYNGHIILLESTQLQVAPGEKYLHELAQHALWVLQVITLMPNTRKLVVGSSLSNERPGMAAILDAVSSAAFVDPEVIQPALLVLVNLVCPPPSLCSRSVISSSMPTLPSTTSSNGQTAVTNNGSTAMVIDTRERPPRLEDKGDTGISQGAGNASVLASPSCALVGDARISLGPGSGGAGLAAFMEQGYRYAREAVRANNGIKVLLHLLYPKTVLPPSGLDCIRALACRVLLGLARDDAIAQILTKLQVGKLLSELLRDGSQAGRQASVGGEQGKWQTELGQAALDLMAIVTNAGRASTVASEAAAPTLRRIERAAIAAATPISYHPRELLQLIHEHLLASGLISSAEALLKEAQITPLDSSLPIASLPCSSKPQDTEASIGQWPSGRVIGGLLASGIRANKDEDERSIVEASRKKIPSFSAVLSASKSPQLANKKITNGDGSDGFKTPAPIRGMPVKRKADMPISSSPYKRLHVSEPAVSPCLSSPHVRFRNNFIGENPTGTPMVHDGIVRSSLQSDKLELQTETVAENLSLVTPFTPSTVSHPSILFESKPSQNERATLDSLVVQYLKHQHRQCPAPITTLPPLSLLHPHICPEPSRILDAPYNTAGRLGFREINPPYGGAHGRRHDRHFIYSRFRPVRTFRDETVVLMCATFLGHGSCLAVGSHAGDIRFFDTIAGNLMETHIAHQTPISTLESSPQLLTGNGDGFLVNTSQLLLSSSHYDVRLWNSSAMSNVVHTFESCKAGKFNHSGNMFGAVNLELSHKEVLLYDIGTCKLEQRLSDSSIASSVQSRAHAQPLVHFSPSDVLVLWSGVLWDHRLPRAIHRFDQFTDYGGGGFHPAGNEVIINSEVWDMRTFKLLRSVPSLDQTVIRFNANGDVIYATLRRNSDDLTAALQHRRTRHNLFAAFRTMDAVDYSDIATTAVDRCVLDLATDSTDSSIAVVAMDGAEVTDSFVRLYEVGRRRPTDDDSDPDDAADSEEEESEGEEDEDNLLADDDSDDIPSNEDDGDGSEDEDDGDNEDGDNDIAGDFIESSDDDMVPGGFVEILGGDLSTSDEESDGEFDDDILAAFH